MNIKQVLRQTAGACGLFTYARRSRRIKSSLSIFCYHSVRITDELAWRPDCYIKVDQLEQRFRFFKAEGYSVLPLAEGYSRLMHGTLPERSVCLTFDNGFQDFKENAYPLLSRFGYPATVYLTTYYCDVNRPVFDLVGPYMLWLRRDRTMEPSSTFGWTESQNLTSANGRRAAWLAINKTVERCRLSGVAKDELMEELADLLDIDYSAQKLHRHLNLLNPDEVAACSGSGITFELHTHRHITPEDPSLLEREIRENSERIASFTGRRPQHFCYPNGIVPPSAPTSLSSLGIQSATTCVPGFANTMSNPMLLPRYCDSINIAGATFESCASGFETLASNALRTTRNSIGQLGSRFVQA